jgi:hypothetical protein
MTSQHQSGDSSNKGKNLGQGLANINDNQRRDLAGSGDDAPTQDQRGIVTSDRKGLHERGFDESRLDENQGDAQDRSSQH